MNRRRFVFDRSLCFGCHGCVAACSRTRQAQVTEGARQLYKLPPRGGRSDTTYLSLSCNHCEHAPCIRACPSGALVRRAEDGVVLHLEDRCLGCRYCQMACPYEAISWNEQTKTVMKCDFCSARLDAGEEPACVATCFAGALRQEVVATGEEDPAVEREAPGFIHHPGVGPSLRFVRPTTTRGARSEGDE